MGKLTDVQIKAWIRSGERFEGRPDGEGLWLRFRVVDALPSWRFRYRFAGKARVVTIGSYQKFTLAEARRFAHELGGRVAAGYDVAAEKQSRKREALAKIEDAKGAVTVGKLADEFYAKNILKRWKHPEIVRSRIESEIKPAFGSKRVDDVRPKDVDALLQKVVSRGAPTVANDVLRWCKRIFDYGIKRHYRETNPAGAFDLSDAGGKESPRDRWLTREEIIRLFAAMREAMGSFAIENQHAVRLLLLLAVRKSELITARWREFDLDARVWHLPKEQTKTGVAIDIPLPMLAVENLRELKRLANGSDYLFPARKQQTRMLPHISVDTLNAALAKHVRSRMAEIPAFSVHDFRRTARTHLALLGVAPHIAEACLNHKPKGIESVYNQSTYYEERKRALAEWASLLAALEQGNADYNVIDLQQHRGR